MATFVRFPDLFVGFLAESPRIHPSYAEVRASSEKRFQRMCQLSDETASAVNQCNFAYFGAIMVPDATRKRYETICDWGNWVFPWDDLFDNGGLRSDELEARQMIETLTAVFSGSMSALAMVQRAPLIRWHDCVWIRLLQEASYNCQRRYARAMQDYCSGALDQVRVASSPILPDVETMLANRRRSVCVTALFALAAFGQGLDIEDAVLDHPLVKELEHIAIDLILLHNDLISYQKEVAEGVLHNMLVLCRARGMCGQQAIDHIASHIDDRRVRFERAVANFARERWLIERGGKLYIVCVKNTVAANLHWSFRSGRFLTEPEKESIARGGMELGDVAMAISGKLVII